jgi:hypothetical protein
VNENHTNMVKFPLEEDDTYRCVVNHMKEWLKTISERDGSKATNRTTISQKYLTVIVALLILLVGHLMGSGRVRVWFSEVKSRVFLVDINS